MRLILLFFLLVVRAATAADRTEDQRIELIKVTCYTCHAVAASEPMSIPALNNVLDNASADEIARILLDYKYDRQAATIMNRIAKALDDEDIYRLAEQLHADTVK